MNFLVGSTVVCLIEVRDVDTNNLVDAASVTLRIYKNSGEVALSSQDMERLSAGKYKYNFDSNGQFVGRYITEYTVIDQELIAIELDEFQLV